jgi:hypothetical protein
MTQATYAALTGITLGSGQCDRCGRELGRVFGVRWPDGTEQTLGRRCAAKATGWAAGAVEREAARLRRLAERDERRTARRAELVAAGHGERLAWLDTHAGVIPGIGCANAAMCVLHDVLDGATPAMLYESIAV